MLGQDKSGNATCCRSPFLDKLGNGELHKSAILGQTDLCDSNNNSGTRIFGHQYASWAYELKHIMFFES